MSTHIKNSLVKTKYQNLFTLRRYVNFEVFKFNNSNGRHFFIIEVTSKLLTHCRSGIG